MTRLSCNQIPTRANGYGGMNWTHLCDHRFDPSMLKSDRQLSLDARAATIQRIGQLLAEDLPMLPLDVLPNVAAWRTDRIAGVDPKAVSSPYGFFFGVTSWYAV